MRADESSPRRDTARLIAEGCAEDGTRRLAALLRLDEPQIEAIRDEMRATADAVASLVIAAPDCWRAKRQLPRCPAVQAPYDLMHQLAQDRASQLANDVNTLLASRRKERYEFLYAACVRLLDEMIEHLTTSHGWRPPATLDAEIIRQIEKGGA